MVVETRYVLTRNEIFNAVEYWLKWKGVNFSGIVYDADLIKDSERVLGEVSCVFTMQKEDKDEAS